MAPENDRIRRGMRERAFGQRRHSALQPCEMAAVHHPVNLATRTLTLLSVDLLQSCNYFRVMTKSAAALRISESEKLTNGRNRRVPTLGQMIREAEADQQIIRRATRRALEAWFRQAARLHIAKHHHHLKGSRFLDFAHRIGVDDQASAYQLVHLHRYRDDIMSDCNSGEAEAKQADDVYHWPGWEAALSRHHTGRNRSRRTMPNDNRDNPIDEDDFPAPSAIFERFGSRCTLDVAASPRNAKCKKFYTKEQDGLKQRWNGIVWMNPPYRDLAAWCAKGVEYAKQGGTVIALLPAWTDAAWFHDYIPMSRVTLLRSRLTFARMAHASERSAAAPFASMIVEWSPGTVNRCDNGLDVHLDDRKRRDDTDAR
jgi:phage N-6-adenine-methyltransferase